MPGLSQSRYAVTGDQIGVKPSQSTVKPRATTFAPRKNPSPFASRSPASTRSYINHGRTKKSGKSSDGSESFVFHQTIELADPSDLTIAVFSHPVEGVVHVTEFDVLSIKCKASRYLEAQIRESSDPIEIEVSEQDSDGMHIWLAHLHELSIERMKETGVLKVSIMAIWHLFAIFSAHDSMQNISTFQLWFQHWYELNLASESLDLNTANSLAFISQVLDHPVGYARATQYLTYRNPGYITERIPTAFKHVPMHLPSQQFVGPVNHARGRIKSILHRQLETRLASLVHYGAGLCTCWSSTAGEYLSSLTMASAFPLEAIYPHSSVMHILEGLDHFEYDHIPGCQKCRDIDWCNIVQVAKNKAETYFDGVCLDCQERSRTNPRISEAQYWDNNVIVRGQWDKRCRVPHGEETWYMSWTGKHEMRRKLLNHAKGRPDNRDSGDEDFQ